MTIMLLLFAGCLLSQQHASVSQGQICSDISGTDLLVYLRDRSASVSQGQICSDISGTDLLVYLMDRSASVSQGQICSDISGTDLLVYLRDRSAQTIQCAPTLREKLLTKLSTSPRHSILTPGQPVIALILPGAWQGSQWSINFEVTCVTSPGKPPCMGGSEKFWFY